MTTLRQPAVSLRRWTVAEYYRMAEVGMLGPEERTELIDGQIIQMSPQDPLHASVIRRASKILNRRLGEAVDVCLQLPISLSNDTEPEPDITVVRPNPGEYSDHHPRAEDIYLLIEVANSSLLFDV